MPVDRSTIAAHVRAMLDAEGPYHVEGWYIADVDLAARTRWLAAERRARDDARRAADTAPLATASAVALADAA